VFPRRVFDVPLPDGHTLRLGERTLVMGVLNVTPDSFAERHPDPGLAVERALEMQSAGADIVDVGGESTRPGAGALPADEELGRVLPVVRALAGRLRVPLSIDTYKASVAEAALDLGAAIVNDISALGYDPALIGVVARRRAAVVLMHTRGRPEDMYREARYADVVAEVGAELAARAAFACAAGIPRERLVLDPGLGFAKRPEQSGVILARLPDLARLEYPLLVGPSRKSFLDRAIGARTPSDREWATAAAVTAAVLAGAHVVRVHGVEAIVDVVRVADMLRRDAGLDAQAP
jgi:dihydropteroate synthase